MRISSPSSIVTLRQLRERIAAVQPASPVAPGQVTLGARDIDAVLKGGLKRNALHEIEPEPASAATALGFTLGLAHRAAKDRFILVLHAACFDAENGRLYPQGLAEWGLDPARILLFRARNTEAVLRASLEAARCEGLGSAIVMCLLKDKSDWLAMSRKFSLAAESSGTPLFFLNAGTPQNASAAATRWRVKALPSLPLAANAPGHMRCSIDLIRHRGGPADFKWSVEWNRDDRSFALSSPVREITRKPPLSRDLVSIASGLPRDAERRKAG
jgi:protein ImuA